MNAPKEPSVTSRGSLTNCFIVSLKKSSAEGAKERPPKNVQPEFWFRAALALPMRSEGQQNNGSPRNRNLDALTGKPRLNGALTVHLHVGAPPGLPTLTQVFGSQRVGFWQKLCLQKTLKGGEELVPAARGPPSQTFGFLTVAAPTVPLGHRWPSLRARPSSSAPE
jgi:hypothetical protein